MIESQTITPDHFVTQGEGNILSDMGGDKVMLSVQKGKYYNLGEIGGKIWDAIETKISVEELVTALLNEYDVEREQCEHQVVSFLEHLLNEGLIQCYTN